MPIAKKSRDYHGSFYSRNSNYHTAIPLLLQIFLTIHTPLPRVRARQADDAAVGAVAGAERQFLDGVGQFADGARDLARVTSLMRAARGVAVLALAVAWNHSIATPSAHSTTAASFPACAARP